jgi:glycerol uptake facilitator protein
MWRLATHLATEDTMETDLVRRLGAEALGTFILTFFGGAAVVAAILHSVDTGVLAPLAFGLALFTAVNVVGSTSGAHVNPTVTLSLALRGRFPWNGVVPYVLAQTIGGIVAGFLLYFTFGHLGVKAGLATTHIATVPFGGHAAVAALLAEALGTFLLCFTVISATDPNRESTAGAPAAIGLSLAVGIFALGGVSGGGFNFARTLGPELVLWFAHGSTAWSHIWVYLAGPVIGAVVAAYLHRAFPLGSPSPAAPEEPVLKPDLKSAIIETKPVPATDAVVVDAARDDAVLFDSVEVDAVEVDAVEVEVDSVTVDSVTVDEVVATEAVAEVATAVKTAPAKTTPAKVTAARTTPARTAKATPRQKNGGR